MSAITWGSARAEAPKAAVLDTAEHHVTATPDSPGQGWRSSRRVATGAGFLKRNCRADGEEIVDLADGCQIRRSRDPAHAPSGNWRAVHAVDHDGAVAHGDGHHGHMPETVVEDVLVDFIGDGQRVELLAESGDEFDRPQLELIAGLCQEFDALAITDEIYEHILYDGFRHVPMMTIPGMRDRTIMVNSMSKTYAVTGWRVGWVAASPDLTESIRKVHDFLTVGAATPLQEAGTVALGLPDDYYASLAQDYQGRRDMMLAMLERAGFRCFRPRGAYYVMADISAFKFENDVTFARHLIEHVGIAAVPGSSFFFHPTEGESLIRFCFCKKYETLELTNERLLRI